MSAKLYLLVNSFLQWAVAISILDSFELALEYKHPDLIHAHKEPQHAKWPPISEPRLNTHRCVISDYHYRREPCHLIHLHWKVISKCKPLGEIHLGHIFGRAGLGERFQLPADLLKGEALHYATCIFASLVLQFKMVVLENLLTDDTFLKRWSPTGFLYGAYDDTQYKYEAIDRYSVA